MRFAKRPSALTPKQQFSGKREPLHLAAAAVMAWNSTHFRIRKKKLQRTHRLFPEIIIKNQETITETWVCFKVIGWFRKLETAAAASIVQSPFPLHKSGRKIPDFSFRFPNNGWTKKHKKKSKLWRVDSFYFDQQVSGFFLENATTSQLHTQY